MTMPQQCRSCHAEIIWAKTETGKTIPIDVRPDPRGKLVLHDQDGVTYAIHEANAELIQTPDRYVAHFATCEHSDQWRRRGLR